MYKRECFNLTRKIHQCHLKVSVYFIKQNNLKNFLVYENNLMDEIFKVKNECHIDN